jgi:hypothetical protein
MKVRAVQSTVLPNRKGAGLKPGTQKVPQKGKLPPEVYVSHNFGSGKGEKVG